MQTKRLSKSERNALPKKGDKYYYIFTSMMTHQFEVRETTFYDGISERMRIARGNVFMVKKDCQEVADQMNDYMKEVTEHYLAAEIDEAQKKCSYVLD